MTRKPKPPHPPHPSSGDMPWLDPGKLPKPKREPLPIQEAMDRILGILRSLSSQHDRHRCIGYVLASLIESEHIKGLSDVWQIAMHDVNRYEYIDR